MCNRLSYDQIFLSLTRWSFKGKLSDEVMESLPSSLKMGAVWR